MQIAALSTKHADDWLCLFAYLHNVYPKLNRGTFFVNRITSGQAREEIRLTLCWGANKSRGVNRASEVVCAGESGFKRAQNC